MLLEVPYESLVKAKCFSLNPLSDMIWMCKISQHIILLRIFLLKLISF